MASLEDSLAAALSIPGATAVALVDYHSGMTLGSDSADFDVDLAAAGSTDVVRAEMRTLESLGQQDRIEDILITLGGQYRLIRLLESNPGLFLLLVLDKSRANLAMARHKLTTLERDLVI